MPRSNTLDLTLPITATLLVTTLGCHGATEPPADAADAEVVVRLDAATQQGDAGGVGAVDAAAPDADGPASAVDAGADGGGRSAPDAGLVLDAAMPPPPVPGCSREHAPGRHALSFEVQGVMREALIYVPQGYTGDTPLPLTFNLHGTGGNPAGQQDYSAIEPLADAKGFIVAALAGYQGRWNVARSPDQPDDVAFAEVVLDWAAENLCVDPGRVFSTGYSGGARTSSRLACALPTRIRAIAPVAGVRHDAPCEVSDMPVLTFHGTGDQTNFYGGCSASDTACSRNGEWVESVEAAIADWRSSNGCSDSARYEQLSDTIERQSWTDCAGSAQVIFYKVRDGGHIWQLLPNTTEVVLDFFLAQPPR